MPSTQNKSPELLNLIDLLIFFPEKNKINNEIITDSIIIKTPTYIVTQILYKK